MSAAFKIFTVVERTRRAGRPAFASAQLMTQKAASAVVGEFAKLWPESEFAVQQVTARWKCHECHRWMRVARKGRCSCGGRAVRHEVRR